MPFYAGVDGVVRECDSVYTNVGSFLRRAITSHVGVEGVVRDLDVLTDKIQRIVIELYRIEVWEMDSSGVYQSFVGEGTAVANQYGGSVSVSEKQITVSASQKLMSVDLYHRAIAIFTDGWREDLQSLLNHHDDVSISGNVTGKLSGNLFFYSWDVLGAVKKGNVDSGTTFTLPIGRKGTGWNAIATRTANGGASNTVTFGDISINGVGFPVTVENNLPN